MPASRRLTRRLKHPRQPLALVTDTGPCGAGGTQERQVVYPASKGHFTTSDGVQLYYEDTGGSGRPLLYVYGLGCSIRHWKYNLAYFGDNELAQELLPAERSQTPRRQVWLDLRGHGHSEPPLSGQRLRIELITRDLFELCQHLSIQSAVVLGQSMGGSIGLHLAHAHPDLVAGLVLLASPGRDPTDHLPFRPLTRPIWQGLIALNNRAPMLTRAFYSAMQAYSRLPGVAPLATVSMLILREMVRQSGFNPQLARTADIEEYIGKIFAVRADLFYDMADDLRLFDIADYEPKIACPTLVIAGARDKVIPLREARRLVRHLPHGELAVVRHGSHCPHFDDPPYVNKVIEQFLTDNLLG